MAESLSQPGAKGSFVNLDTEFMERNLRLFIAGVLPNEVITKVSEVVDDLKGQIPDVKWESEDKIHITLKFLGSVAEEDEKKISVKILDILKKGYSSIELGCTGLDVFPNIRNPRVLVLKLSSNDTIYKLKNDIESVLKPLGIEKDKLAFNPHITIGRIKGKRIKFDIKGYGVPKIAFRLNQLALVKSVLTKKGSIYSKLNTFSI